MNGEGNIMMRKDCPNFVEEIEERNARLTRNAKQYAVQLMYVVDCMLSSSIGNITNSNFPLARAQAETLIARIKKGG